MEGLYEADFVQTLRTVCHAIAPEERADPTEASANTRHSFEFRGI